MRLNLAQNVDSRDGTTNKDTRLTNVLKEIDHEAELAVVRPGLVSIAMASGNGRGVTRFGDRLISVYGTTLGYGETPTTINTVAAGIYDFCQSPL